MSTHNETTSWLEDDIDPVSFASDIVNVRWYCGGPRIDCEYEFDTEEDADDWREEECRAECPSCGEELTQEKNATLFNDRS